MSRPRRRVGAREVTGDARRERKRAKHGGEGKEAEGARDSHEPMTLPESVPPVIAVRVFGGLRSEAHFYETEARRLAAESWPRWR